MHRKTVGWALAGLAVLAVAIQLVPYGRNWATDDPPGRREPAWDSPQTRALARRACFDCHSDETAWPWYAHVAPASWLLQRDVDTGRRRLNFSEWDRPQRGARPQAIDRRINSGSMPPWYYLLPHPDARLSASETQALRDGLDRTVAQQPPAGR